MIKLEMSVHINRPVAEVFEYLTDPARTPAWNATIEEATASETPLRVGTRVRTRMRMLGRTIEGTYEVVEYEPNKRFAWKGEEPFPMKGINTYQTENGGTRIVSSSEGELGGFFKLSEPILARIVKKQLQVQFETAKELLEAEVPAET